MTIDPTVFAGAIVTVIGALTISVVSIISSFGKMKVDIIRELTVQSNKIQSGQTQAADKVKEIHSLVNGASEKAAEHLVKMADEIKFLHQKISEIQQARIDEAQVKNTMKKEKHVQ